MPKSLRNRLLLIAAIFAAACYFAFPLEKRINLGLDLKGGMHLVLKIDPCNSTIDIVPARWCKPSMFCVITANF